MVREALASGKLTKEQIKEAGARLALIKETEKNVVVSGTQTGANITEAGSFSVLTVKIREAAAAM